MNLLIFGIESKKLLYRVDSEVSLTAFLEVFASEHMKRNGIDTHIERKIDLYVNGKLDQHQIDELWSELIQDESALDYLKTVANLKELAGRERELYPGRARQSGYDRTNEPRTPWMIAAAAAVLLMIGSWGVLQLDWEDQQPEPIAQIELDYYRSGESSIDPTSDETVIREAIILANRGEHLMAIDLLEQELESTSDSYSRSQLYLNAGSILYNNSSYAEAASRFERIVNEEIGDLLIQERAWWYLGNTYFQLNRMDEALQAFRRAYELNGAYSRVAESYLKALAAE